MFSASSRETVDGSRSMLAAIARIESPAVIPSRILSRSVMFKKRDFTGSTSDKGGIPPASLNHTYPRLKLRPRHAEASSIVDPERIACQNRR